MVGDIFPLILSSSTITLLTTSISSAGASVKGDMLAQTVSKALSNCLPGITVSIQSQSHSVASSMSHADNSSPSACFTQTPVSYQQQQVTFPVPSFVSLFALTFKPGFWFAFPVVTSKFSINQSWGWRRLIISCYFCWPHSSEKIMSLAQANLQFTTNLWTK